MDKIPHRPHHFATKKVVLLGILFLLIALLSLWGTYYIKHKIVDVNKASSKKLITPFITQTPSETQVFCTMDAKVCPDGSSVGRIPPSCEFAECSEN